MDIKNEILEALSVQKLKADLAGSSTAYKTSKDYNYHYSVYHVGAGNVLKNRENLNADEIEDFIRDPKLVNRTANIKVVRNDGKAVTYTHTGSKWAIVSKETLKAGDRYIP